MNSLIFLVLSFSLLFVAPITARVKQYQANSPSPFASPAPGPSNSDCSNVIYDMMDCLSYLSPGSNDTKPGQACCVGIRSVMQYNPHCICVGLATSNDMGIALNTTRALASPSTCNIPIASPHCDIAMPGALTPTPVPPQPPSSAKSPMSPPSVPKSPTKITPAPTNSDCSSVIYDMMDCLSYLTPGSNDTTPGKACCVGIQSVLEYNPHCICVGLTSSKDMGIELDTTRALAAPKACNIPIAAPHCDVAMPGSSAPVTSTPVAPSAKTSPVTSQTSVGAPRSSPSLTESPSPSPSHSGTNNLSVSTLTFFAVSSLIYISAIAF